MQAKAKRFREPQIELLRIFSMAMVIVLHYLGKGELLPDFQTPLVLGEYISYGLESLSIVAVNVFVLISGYFFLEQKLTFAKVSKLWFQIFFYAIGIPIVLGAMGLVGRESFGFYELLNYCFPISMNVYWFATAYFILLLLSPFLAAGLHTLHKKTLGISLLGLLLFVSGVKTILPFSVTLDAAGYDVLWLLCVYLVGGYMRKYGIPFLTNIRRSVFCYFLLAGCSLLWNLMIGFLFLQTGKFSNQIGEAFHYNHLLNLLSAVSFFSIFRFGNIKNERIASCICRISPYVFGVYLLHEHPLLRYQWLVWVGVEIYGKSAFLFIHLLLCIILLFVIGIIVDFIRMLLWKQIEKYIALGIKRKRNG